MWLGNVLLDLNDVDGAFEHYKAGLLVDPLHTAVQIKYLWALYAQGRSAEAIKLADQYYAQSKAEQLLKARLFLSLNTGAYDDVLKLAVRHNFSDEYVGFATEVVIEALIYLQRYAEAQALIAQNRQRLSDAQMAWFSAEQAIASRDADGLLKAAKRMEVNDATIISKAHSVDCRLHYVNHWRGLAASLNNNHTQANTF